MSLGRRSEADRRAARGRGTSRRAEAAPVPFANDVAAVLRAAIADGPPAAVEYARENFGRYLHTLTWLAHAASPGGRLLDVGIYPGHLALALTRLGTDVHGLGRFVPPEFRDHMARRGVAVEDVDLERELIPHPPDAFDVVLATEILEHLVNPGLLLSESFRVLKPGRTLYLSTPNLVDLRNRARVLLGRSPQEHLFGTERPFRLNEWVHRREYTPAEVTCMLREVGFTAVEVRTWTPAGGGAAGVPWLRALVNRLPALGGTIFALARKSDAPPGRPGRTDRALIVPSSEFLEGAAGEAGTLDVRLRNVGTSAWPAGDQAGCVLLGAHLLGPNGHVLDRDFARNPLPGDVAPGDAVDLACGFVMPARRGVFLLELDLVREGEHWFGDDASPTARAVLRVV